MRKSKNWLALVFLACLTAMMIKVYQNPVPVLPTINLSNLINANLETERTDGGYYTIKDEDGREITATALPVYPGDEYIAEDNKHYRIVSVQGDTAMAKFLGVDHFAYNPAWDEEPTATAATGGKRGKIAVYHTHSDESYVPTDGKSSIYGNGGIFKVGNAYTKSMESQGVDVIHSTRPHDPHDPNAYQRSRRTAVELLKSNPAALVDVHRDAVPAQVYRNEVEGKQVTQVKLVVGRRNPKKAENLQFAQNIKAYVDKNKPGLIEGIFLAKGSYNQELSPRAILIEAGSHTNSRVEAQKGLALFAEAIPKVSGVATSAGPGAAKGPGVQAPTTPQAATPGRLTDESNTSWSTLIWILAAVIIGIGAFLFISTGSVSESWKKVKSFSGQEFANALFRRKNKHK